MSVAEGEFLPAFRYHPDPLGSGSVVASAARCRCCGKARGHVYAGPVYSEEEDLDDALCPWCIADGKAAAKFDATFVDSEAFAAAVPEEMARVVCERTPGFCAWQTERWPVCCGEPAAFVRPAGLKEIRQAYPQAEGELMMFIVHELGISGGAARRMLESLRRDQSPTAFVFKCLHCDATPVYADSI